MNNNPFHELKEIMYKIRSRSQRIQESTQNPSQETLDALYDDVSEAYVIVSNLYNKHQSETDTP